MIGESVGNYRILSELGRGGMGVVYVAQHVSLGRRAAVKMLLPRFSQNHSIVQRFFNEAKAASNIKHAGIVQIYELGDHAASGAAFIVMELLDGESLETRIARGRIDSREALNITRQIAGILAAAHKLKIVHRDLKPDNVFLVPDDEMPFGYRVKLLDFGIAKLAGENTPSAFATQTGALMGTPAYMAPEQCKGAANVDARADLYSLGCILFHLLCRRPPFDAEFGGEVLAAHIRDEPPSPRGLNPGIARPLEGAILKLLAKSPDDRFQSASELRAKLKDLAKELDKGAAAAAKTVTPADLETWRPDQGIPDPDESTPAEADDRALAAQPGPDPSTPRWMRAVTDDPVRQLEQAQRERHAANEDSEPGTLLDDGQDLEVPGRITSVRPRRSKALLIIGGIAVAAVALAAGIYMMRGDDETPLSKATDACSSGDTDQCAAVAAMYDSGDGVEANPGRAIAFHAKACAGGHRNSCDELDGNACAEARRAAHKAAWAGYLAQYPQGGCAEEAREFLEPAALPAATADSRLMPLAKDAANASGDDKRRYLEELSEVLAELAPGVVWKLEHATWVTPATTSKELSKLLSRSHGLVYVQKGRYTYETTLAISKAKHVAMIAEPGTEIFVRSGKAVLEIASSEAVYVHGVYMNHHEAWTKGSRHEYDAWCDATVYKPRIKNSDVLVIDRSSKLFIRNSELEGSGFIGLRARSSTDISVRDSIIHDCISEAIRLESSHADVDNVLMFNVGSRQFRKTCKWGNGKSCDSASFRQMSKEKKKSMYVAFRTGIYVDAKSRLDLHNSTLVVTNPLSGGEAFEVAGSLTVERSLVAHSRDAITAKYKSKPTVEVRDSCFTAKSIAAKNKQDGAILLGQELSFTAPKDGEVFNNTAELPAECADFGAKLPNAIVAKRDKPK